MPSPQVAPLFFQYQVNPSIRLRNQLVEANIGLIHKAARPLHKGCSDSYDDIFQAGTLGLISAVERFDPALGNRFSSFAMPYIRGRILQYRRDKDRTVRVPRVWQDQYHAVRKKQKQVAKLEGYLPTETQAAEATGLTVTDWQTVKRAMTGWCLPLFEEACEEMADENAVATMERQTEYAEVLAELDSLPVANRRAIELIFFDGLRHEQAAKRMKVSVTRVQALVDEGIKTLEVKLNANPAYQHGSAA